MSREYAGYTRFALVLAIKGAFMAALGLVALLWSTTTLVNAMMFASLLLAVAGLYEIVLGVQYRRHSRGWLVPVGDGLASLGLAALSVTLTAIPLSGTMVLSAIWLGGYGVALAALALAVWPMTRTRRVLLAVAAVDLLLAGMTASDAYTIFTVLYAGAAYAILFGAFQVTAGWWIRTIAVPEVAPTRQSGWHPAAPR